MKTSQYNVKKLIIMLAFFSVPFLLTGCSHRPQPEPTKPRPINLTIWRLADDRSAFQAIIKAFEAANTNVKVNYRTFAGADEYEQVVINALAAGTGPDIWEIRNDELARHKDKLLGFPLSEEGLKFYRENFASSITSEMTSEGKIYGLPLGLDPLVLYVNVEHFKQLGVKEIPKTWQEIIQLAPQLTIRANETILRPGFAFGTASNVDRSSDILQLLMLQFKTQMVDPAHRTATFELYRQSLKTGEFSYPGKLAFSLYASFAAPDSPLQNYSWNLKQPYSTLAFIDGNLSMMINHLSLLPQIRRQNPKLNVRVGPVPQYEVKTPPQEDQAGSVSDPVHLAKYRALVVSKPSVRLTSVSPKGAPSGQTQLETASKFVQFVTTNQALLSAYSNQTGLVPPYLISQSSSSANSGSFASQVALAVNPYLSTWYKGSNPRTVDRIFAQLIKEVVEEGKPVDQAFSEAAKRVTSLLP